MNLREFVVDVENELTNKEISQDAKEILGLAAISFGIIMVVCFAIMVLCEFVFPLPS